MKVFCKILILAMLITGFAQHAGACTAPPPGQPDGDDLFWDGNLIFLGIVIRSEVVPATKGVECLKVTYKPEDILFGKPSDPTVFEWCSGGPIDRSEIDELSENLAVTLGARGLIGLTKRAWPQRQIGGLRSGHRPLMLGCYPFLIRTDLEARRHVTKQTISALRARVAAHQSKEIWTKGSNSPGQLRGAPDFR